MRLSSRFSEALAYAVLLHGGQQRKVSGAPYVGHLLRVAGTVIEHGGDEDESIAALLHDAVEDQGGEATRAEIDRRFGARIAAIVEGCSDCCTHPKPPWRRRKEDFVRQLADQSASVRLIVAADKLDNVRCLFQEYRARGDDLWEHFRGGSDGTKWYYRAVVEALKKAGSAPLVDELQRLVAELERAAR